MFHTTPHGAPVLDRRTRPPRRPLQSGRAGDSRSAAGGRPGALGFLILAVLAGHAAYAQPPEDDNVFGNVFSELGDLTPDAFGDPVQVQAQVVLDPNGETGRLVITAMIAPGTHIYALTQGKDARGGGPEPTRIRLELDDAVNLTGQFQPDPEPTKHTDKEIWVGLELEEHEQRVTWTAPISIAPTAVHRPLTIRGVVDTQACDDRGCLPLKLDFTAAAEPSSAGAPAAGGAAPARPLASAPPPSEKWTLPSAGEYRKSGSHVELIGRLTQPQVAPGNSAEILLTAVPDKGWHIYAWALREPETLGSRPTLITIERADGLRVHHAETEARVIAGHGISGDPETPYHKGEVTWRIQIDVPADATPGERLIRGVIGYQACADQCERPLAARFEVPLVVAPGDPAAPPAAALPLTFSEAGYADAARVAAAVSPAPPDSRTAASHPVPPPSGPAVGADDKTFSAALILGFLGGIILNVMPCVLPVVGLKIFAFIEQAGEQRSKTFALNVWYSLGVISVFLALAALAATFRLGWGQLFQYAEFNIVMASVIFAMGLSFLGVWEIPIPGFIGTSSVTEIGEREGYEGAFVKGAITTLLATPCTGPLMGTALIGVLGRPTPQIFAIFFAIGLGMASPYLLIGALPELARFLPKPGEWMNTFKQIMGFVLIGTVVYLLTLLKPYYVVPTITLMFSIWFACWWIGRVPLTAEAMRRWRAYGEAAIVASLLGMFAFNVLAPVMQSRAEDAFALRFDREIETRSDGLAMEYTVENKPWQPYTARKLKWLQDHQKTVLIDFTADWCPNCKWNEAQVLKTDETEALIRELGIYTLIADWSHKEDAVEVTAKLEELRAKQIPLVAIYPGSQPDRPIVIPGTLSKADLHAKLRSAAAGSADAFQSGQREASRVARSPQPQID